MAGRQLPHRGFKDMTGLRFGRLTVIERHHENTQEGTARWRCICDCGNETISAGVHLRGGRTKSCGCFRVQRKPRKRRSDYIDLIGQKFGRLTVIERDPGPGVKFRCACECGGEVVTLGRSLREGHTRSCGCYHKEAARKTMTTHGMCSTSLYKCWCGIVARCSNPNTNQYADYGGRGITVCERWHTFENFLADMGERPTDKHTLDRIDNDGNYESGNCRWATRKEQSANRRKMARIDQFSTEELLAELKRRREKVA